MAEPAAERSVLLMFRTIVIGYDGPERGGEAVALGEHLRDPEKGTLLLAAAYTPAPVPAYGFVPYEAIVELHDQTERAVGEARDALPAATRARSRAVPAASAPRALTELAEAEHADLVVVGSSHRGALGRVVPGTTAERLLHGAPCAVAVAPRGYRGGDVRHLGVAYAVTDNAPQGLRPETLLLHGAPAEEINRRAHDVIDLLFVGSRAYGPLRRALLGTVSGALVRGAACLVVVFPRTALAPAAAVAGRA
jgi:nucleotide-binding universal stress UspA family protein